MAARAVWKGQLRLSLVSIAIEVYPATTSGPRISFRQIHEPSGKRVRYEKTVKGVGPVDTDDIVKGYETDDGEYILIDPDEIDALKVETSRTLELVQFVETGEIPPLYFERPYYIVPQDDLAEDAYRVIRDALRAEGKTALCQITLRGKEHLAAIRPCGDGLLLETLRYEEEIRDADPMFSQIEDAESDEEMRDLARELIDRKTKPFDAAAFSDSYHQALKDLIASKRKDSSSARVEADEDDDGDEGDNVVDLMSALKKSVGESEKGGSGSKGKGPKSGGSKSGSSRSDGSKTSSGSSKSKSKSSGGSGSKKKKAS
ncbi:putative DNA repair protein YkoV [Roseivivax jejudonensis]|uniref:Non-homologous end joining protein Ku n=1 Tax=Roseivivax jejudonensis TaxID=1529041 RepID=A0A1X6ZYK6_9RHOB|nr:Ku protein [Roseivivax jejudonensis]SLN65319.1 putative DNA repair protein YkoV [Roseivivax jejudonensis]